MLTSILYGLITYCAVSIADIAISNKTNQARIQGKMEERQIYESKPSPINPVKKGYDIEEI